jgi:hypothetical protein
MSISEPKLNLSIDGFDVNVTTDINGSHDISVRHAGTEGAQRGIWPVARGIVSVMRASGDVSLVLGGAPNVTATSERAVAAVAFLAATVEHPANEDLRPKNIVVHLSGHDTAARRTLEAEGFADPAAAEGGYSNEVSAPAAVVLERHAGSFPDDFTLAGIATAQAAEGAATVQPQAVGAAAQ